MSPTIHVDEVQIRVAKRGEQGVFAWASCVVNGALYLNNIAIRRDPGGGLLLTYPATRSRSDAKHFHFRPINAEAKEAFDEAILGRLHEMLGAR